MGLLDKFKAGVKKYQDDADQRADRRLARAKTDSEREREEGRIARERLKTKREVAQAKTALLKSEAQRKKAAKEVKDIGGGDFFSGLSRYLQPPKAKRRAARRKVRKAVAPKAKKRVVRRKPRGTVTTVTRTVTRGR